VTVGCVISCEPDGGEVAPSKLAHNHIAAVVKVVANVDGVISAGAVVLEILLVLGKDGGCDRGRPGGRLGVAS
jgi:hypothetical protein